MGCGMDVLTAGMKTKMRLCHTCISIVRGKQNKLQNDIIQNWGVYIYISFE